MAISRQDVDATIELLCERFPRCFFMFERKRLPLKVGIFDDIAAQLEGAIESRLLSAALTHYCCNLAYRAAQLEGVARIDLDGNPAGAVSDKDALSAARSAILAKAALREKKRAEVGARATSQPPLKPEIAPEIDPARHHRLRLHLRSATVCRRFERRRLGERQQHEFGDVQLDTVERRRVRTIARGLHEPMRP
jgi:sRNA-binding protein